MNKLKIIAAVSIDGVVGVNNKIPWYIPEDFKHFRNTTIGNILVVGYNTYLTLPPKAFEKRKYMVLRSNKHRLENIGDNIYQFKSLDTIMYLLKLADKLDTVYVIGGAMLYESMIDYCDEVVITWVNKTYLEGDKKFPIEKLQKDFTATTNEDWQLSVGGEEYKIINYKRNGE